MAKSGLDAVFGPENNSSSRLQHLTQLLEGEGYEIVGYQKCQGCPCEYKLTLVAKTEKEVAV